MPWELIKLNDGTCIMRGSHECCSRLSCIGTSIPSVAFGTWTLGGGSQATDFVDQAISVGFSHIGKSVAAPCRCSSGSSRRAFADTAQSYQNEAEAGKAIRESGLPRKDLYITTKFSGRDGLDIETSIQNSLKFVSSRLSSAP